MDRVQFYKEVGKENHSSELVSILENYPDCEFYELCQKFIDVGLNAPKRMNNDGTIGGSFQPNDIESARDAVVAFIDRFKIMDIDEFLRILKLYYPRAANPEDPRKRTAMIMNESYTLGQFFSFSVLPDEIFELIAKEIKESIQDKST